ncbi:copper chaperone PCu(A)C [Streptomyces sp. NPDC013178]|uniref:copper chaperone PCu(A)C n=1 Tax=unclassified Streptomyces TaxID=2593676 RepID=UPI0033D8BE04
MSSSLRRGALAASALVFSIATLAACGAGNDAQTLEIKPDNAATSVGDIKLQNVVVITQPDPESTGPAVVSATVFNSGDKAQTLDSISVDGGETAEISPAGGKGKLTIPAGGSVVIGGEHNASAVLPSGREAVQDGNAQKITFTFSKTGEVGVTAFVVPAESYFTKWGPSDIPTAPAQSPSPNASVSGAPGHEGAEGEGTTGSASPSNSASASASESATTGH